LVQHSKSMLNRSLAWLQLLNQSSFTRLGRAGRAKLRRFRQSLRYVIWIKSYILHGRRYAAAGAAHDSDFGSYGLISSWYTHWQMWHDWIHCGCRCSLWRARLILKSRVMSIFPSRIG
jgi:hypothetical protein